MFNKEFFPTPKVLVRQMLDPLLVNGWLPSMAVLEPSAGKGDICDLVDDLMNPDGARNRAGIYCLESNPELQDVLRGKGFQVLGSDFLAFDGESLWIDLIVMNPPFRDAAAHLLHAWDILQTGQIISILPAEMLRNPHTRERRLLVDLIDRQGGTVENAGQAFRGAERHTDVEVVILRLDKQTDSVLGDIFDRGQFVHANIPGDDAPIIGENELVKHDLIAALVDGYRSTLRSFAGAVRGMRELYIFGRQFGNAFVDDNHGYNQTYNDVLGAFQSVTGEWLGHQTQTDFRHAYGRAYNEFATSARRAAWEQVFSRTELSRFMTAQVQREFTELQRTQQQIEFSAENVTALLGMLLGNRDQIRDRAIVEAFDLMTKYHEENRVHWEGWKTNDFWRVNQKIILPYVMEIGWDGTPRLSYGRRDEELDDIDRGLCLLEGLRFDRIVTIRQAITHACEQPAYRVDWKRHNKCQSTFFDIQFHKKGTGHFKFRDKDVWERFNVAAARGKRWLPGEIDKAS